ncbi:hypothetical protein PIB30_034667 [Stylosanthes scabra]|uniref:Uncharacterized protein n=1 Tax=Stylosanthes scabra TaxID=79078 RepID=A0ABU6QDA8_9FABA|nr:hypothetical protein [Stylosanthes scabra]
MRLCGGPIEEAIHEIDKRIMSQASIIHYHQVSRTVCKLRRYQKNNKGRKRISFRNQAQARMCLTPKTKRKKDRSDNKIEDKHEEVKEDVENLLLWVMTRLKMLRNVMFFKNRRGDYERNLVVLDHSSTSSAPRPPRSPPAIAPTLSDTQQDASPSDDAKYM